MNNYILSSDREGVWEIFNEKGKKIKDSTFIRSEDEIIMGQK